MEEFTVFRDGEKNLRFEGELIAARKSSPVMGNNRYSGSNGRWSVLKLYKTKGGKFICQRIGMTSWDKESDRYTGLVCTNMAEVVAFFGMSDLAKELYSDAGASAGADVDEFVE